MITRQQASKLIGRPAGRRIMVSQNGTNGDIIKAVLSMDMQACKEVAPLAGKFTGSNDWETGFNIWAWMQKNISYSADPAEAQEIQSPKALLASGVGDCKSFSVMARALLNCHGITGTGYRFTGYFGNKYPSHVYTYFGDNTLDATLTGYDQEPAYKFKKDYPMNTINVYTISGIGEAAPGTQTSRRPSVPLADLYLEAKRKLSNPAAMFPGPTLEAFLAKIDDRKAFVEHYSQHYGYMQGNPSVMMEYGRAKSFIVDTKVYFSDFYNDPEKIKLLIVGYNNKLWAENQAGFLVYPPNSRIPETITFYNNWASRMRSLGWTDEGIFNLLIVMAAEKTNLLNVGFGQQAIGFLETILLIITAVAGLIKAIASLKQDAEETYEQFRQRLEAEGVDIDQLSSDADRLYREGQNIWNQLPGTGGNTGGGTPGTGSTGGGTPGTGSTGGPMMAGVNPLFIGAAALAAFALLKR